MTLNQFDEMEQVETIGREEKAKYDGFCYKIDGFCNVSPSIFALSVKQSNRHFLIHQQWRRLLQAFAT